MNMIILFFIFLPLFSRKNPGFVWSTKPGFFHVHTSNIYFYIHLSLQIPCINSNESHTEIQCGFPYWRRNKELSGIIYFLIRALFDPVVSLSTAEQNVVHDSFQIFLSAGAGQFGCAKVLRIGGQFFQRGLT